MLRERPLETGIEEAVLLGAGPTVRGLWEAATPVASDRKAHAAAAKLWKKRRGVLDAGLDATEALRVDLVQEAQGVDADGRLLVADLLEYEAVKILGPAPSPDRP